MSCVLSKFARRALVLRARELFYADTEHFEERQA